MTDSGERSSALTIEVAEHDTLPDILARVRAARGKAATLSIPEHSPVFLTATEFRTLRDVVETNDVQLTLDTDDPLRLQLASMFNLADFARPSSPEAGADTDGEIESTPSFQGWRRSRPGANAAGDEPGESRADPITISRRRRQERYDVTGSRADGNVGLSEDATFVSLNYIEEGSSHNRAKLVGRVVAIVLVALLVLGIAGWWYMPGTRVEARLLQGQVSTELLFSVVTPGNAAAPDAAFSVEASPTSATVDFDIQVPASGVQSTPDGTAQGQVVLRNASTEALTLPAGTELSTVTGVAFTTDTEANLPPGSADGSTVGETTVAVTASEAGGAGNLGIGELSGKVADQPVYFSNRDEPTAGGSDIEVAVVTEADVQAAEDQVANDLRRAVAEDWTAQLPAGQVILAPAVVPGTPTYTIQQQAGDIADMVVVTGTVDVSGYQYDQTNLFGQARDEYETSLAGQVPAGYQLLPETITLGEPALVSQSPGSVEYTMVGVGTVRAAFSADDRSALQSDLAGRSTDDAISILDNVPAFETWSLDRDPGWWPGGLPRATSRIDIVLDDDVIPQAPATPATPAAS